MVFKSLQQVMDLESDSHFYIVSPRSNYPEGGEVIAQTVQTLPAPRT